MASIKTRRVMRDLLDFDESKAALGVHLTFYADDLSYILVTLDGEEDSPFEGGKFEIIITIPEAFPFAQPKITFLTSVYHPNVSGDDGKVCMDVLDINWNSGTSLLEFAEAARSLLNDPNPSSPLNDRAAVLLEEHPDLYRANAILWCRVCAGGSKEAPKGLDDKFAILKSYDMTDSEVLRRGAWMNWVVNDVIKEFNLD